MSTADETVVEQDKMIDEQDESLLLSLDNITLTEKDVPAKESQASDVNDFVLDQSAEQAETQSDDESAVDDELPIEIEPISEEIIALVEPLAGPVPSGEDPRYGDEFIIVKTEIDKTAYNDYHAVMTLAKEILSNEGKDLRVAGYYLLSNAYINGLKGLLDGLLLYRLLIERFGDSLYPQRESARLSALQWLNNNKILAYAKQHADELDEKLLTRFETEIQLLNDVIMDLHDDHSGCITVLNDWLSTRKKQYEERQTKSNVTRAGSQAGSGNDRAGRSGPPAAGAGASGQSFDFGAGSHLSETELYSMMRSVVNQLLADSDYQRAVSFSRAARWGGMKQPPNENNKTRLTAPRQTGVTEVRNLLQSNDFIAAFKASEGTFFEAGGHMLLDLQFLSYKAAKGMGQIDLANLIAYETAALLKRLPGLDQLRFDDDTVFASADTQSWLAEFAETGQAQLISPADQDKELLDIIEQAKSTAETKGIKPAITIIDQYRPKTDKHRFHLKLAMAQISMDQGKPDLALPILEELSAIAEETSLAMWDTQLAMSVAKYYQNALKGVMADATELKKAQYEQTIEELSAQMCRWDLAYAIHIL